MAADGRRAGAFFDLDNTLLRGASLFYLARGLHLRNFLATRDILHAGWAQLRFRMRGEDPEHVRQAREDALAFIAGWSVQDVTELSEEIFSDVLDTKLWPGTRALTEEHLAQGYPVWLVTAAPIEIARVISARLGLTGALGTVAQSRDGFYTGVLDGELLHGEAKAHAVRDLASREGYDLGECWAYSDSSNDLPMLSIVGKPCAVNPDRGLRKYARAHGWPVRDFRRGRRAARLGVALAAGAGTLAAAAAVGAAVRRRATSTSVRRTPDRPRDRRHELDRAEHDHEHDARARR